MPRYKTLLSIFCLFCLGLPGASFAVWQITTVGTAGGAFNDVTVTAGRDTTDTLLFIYAVSNDNWLYEYGWNGSAWTGGTIGATATNDLRGVAVGCPDSDGNTRVYASSWGGDIYQYLYDGSAWSTYIITPATGNYNRCAIGRGHDSTSQYLFAGNANHRLYEFDRVLDTRTEMDDLGDEFYAADVGDGRNNGVQRVYATNFDTRLYEFTWGGSSYARQEVANEGDLLYAVRVGPGRDKDTTNYLYAGYHRGLVYEYKYTLPSGPWSKVGTLTGPGVDNRPCRGISIGYGRDDGVRRVYASFSDGSVYEFTWNGASWSGVDLGTATGSGLNGLAVGKGRQSESATSVFAAGADSSLYEYRWLTDTPTRSPTITRTATPTPTPSESATQTLTRTPTRTGTPTVTPTISRTATPTPTQTRTPTLSPTFTSSPTHTVTPTISPTFTITRTSTVTPPFTHTRTPTISPTPTVTRTRTRTPTFTVTPTSTRTLTLTISATITRTATITPTSTVSPTYVPATDLSRLVVYPNPYRADRSSAKEIKFGNVPRGSVVKIFALTGEHVRTLEKTDTRFALTWDLRNEAGAPVASGVYVYLVQGGGSEKRGKLALLR